MEHPFRFEHSGSGILLARRSAFIAFAQPDAGGYDARLFYLIMHVT
jgi:hypothetical protein